MENKRYVDKFGNIKWCKESPTLEWKDGSKHWFLNGQLHHAGAFFLELNENNRDKNDQTCRRT